MPLGGQAQTSDVGGERPQNEQREGKDWHG